MKDSRGRESRTLRFVTATWLAMLWAFLYSYWNDTIVPISLDTFGLGVAAVLAIWLGREWTEKNASSNTKD